MKESIGNAVLSTMVTKFPRRGSAAGHDFTTQRSFPWTVAAVLGPFDAFFGHLLHCVDHVAASRFFLARAVKMLPSLSPLFSGPKIASYDLRA
jgi:hypothetical protein